MKKLLGHRPHFGCGDFSCSFFIDTDKTADERRIPFSKFNIPFDFVDIKAGSIVVNIISDLGYEILMASEKTGKHGKVIGIDFSPVIRYRAQYNVEKTGCRNVFFREVFSSKFLPLGANLADICIFNKLLNRFPNSNLFSEIYRTLKPGGAFYIYDIVSNHPDSVATGIASKDRYICNLSDYGFAGVTVRECLKDIPAD
ncbi:MAG: methyltransferase domain-containing protein, partial [Prevotellaceae bacterium]|nr:methyltransferase domain-containing protein [Prevotellaceae bacterium]